MATFFKSPTTLPLTNKEKFVGRRKFTRQQAKALNQLGQVRSYNLGKDFFQITINLDLLKESDKTNLFAFIVNTTNWSQEVFTFTDDRSKVFTNCRFWFDQVSVDLKSPVRSTGTLVVRQDPT